MLEVLRVILDLFMIFFLSMWIIFPAYLANAVAVPVSKGHQFHPIDGGRTFRGQRVFGDGKTIEAFLLASGIGIAGGLAQCLLSPLFSIPSLAWQDFFESIIVPRTDIELYVAANVQAFSRALLFPPGAMLGDLLGSFIKRRLNIPRGAKAPVLDQLDFVLGTILLSLVAIPVGGSFFQLGIVYIIAILVLTPFIHRVVNKLAYKIKIKAVPY
jgi:CDP-2,3-bis-(O-geranylgeranyl)-sn-glycerol synthase